MNGNIYGALFMLVVGFPPNARISNSSEVKKAGRFLAVDYINKCPVDCMGLLLVGQEALFAFFCCLLDSFR